MLGYCGFLFVGSIFAFLICYLLARLASRDFRLEYIKKELKPYWKEDCVITLKTHPGQTAIELGGGENPLVRPNCDIRWCVDANGNPTVDFLADFNEVLPIKDEDFDGVFSRFAIEHISWQKVKLFISEIYRILKPGGKAVIVAPNTLAQMEWIVSHPNGWDNKPLFESASELLYGTQNYSGNFHASFFSPTVIEDLFKEAGFTQVRTQPYGERNTDLVLESIKPTDFLVKLVAKETLPEKYNNKEERESMINSVRNLTTLAHESQEPVYKQITLPAMSREEMYDKFYFNGGGKVGGYAREGYRDFAVHNITFNHIFSAVIMIIIYSGFKRFIAFIAFIAFVTCYCCHC